MYVGLHTSTRSTGSLLVQQKGTMITAQRGDRNITRNSSHFKPVKLETTVIVESDDDENIDSPTETSSSPVGDSHDTEAARNLYESTSRNATETPPPPPPPEANAPRAEVNEGDGDASRITPARVFRRSTRSRRAPSNLDDYQLV